MRGITRIEAFEAIEVLADRKRLAILRRLMAGAATLSQLGHAFGKHPAWIRHHLKQLEAVGLVEMVGTRELPGFTEKYYEATAGSFVISTMIAPAPDEPDGVVCVGSHDLALEALARRVQGSRRATPLSTVALGSLDGLIALRQGAGDLAGCHLLDTEGDVYNAPYVRRLFPGEDMVLVTLAQRRQGLIVAPGNPLRLEAVADLAREGVRLVNRNRGSGTRLWLDRRLREAGIDGSRISGYDHEVSTHTALAGAIAAGQADAGIGLQAAAEALALGFVPLAEERFDLVLSRQRHEDSRLRPVFDELHSGEFRRSVGGLGGYDASECGAEAWLRA